MIPLPYIALGVVLAFTAGYGAGIWHEKGAEEARETKVALTASQEETERARKTVDIVGSLASLPPLADTGVVAGRLDGLCLEPAHSIRLPENASRARPSSAGVARDRPANQKLAADLKACKTLQSEYNALRATWHANEAKP